MSAIYRNLCVRSSSRHCFQVRLDLALRHLVAQPVDGASIEYLAELAGYSRCHFSRLAKSALDEDVSVTARRVRLEMAAYSLLQGSSVKEAALDAGYENCEVLSRTFKSAYGISPSSFSNSGTGEWQLPSLNRVHWSPDASLNEYRVKYDGEWNSVERRPRKRYANVRRTVSYAGVNGVWEELRNYIPESLWDAEGVYFVSVFHDDFRKKCDGLTLQAGIELPPGMMVPPGLNVEDTEEHTYVATVDEVPRQQYSPVWRSLIKRWSSDDDKGTDNNPGFDIHTSFPRPECGFQTRMFYGLNTN